mmetsp:Transcript_37039/g.84168  ORF Transcript_37039/g.84168 Transcript_37039/m.84168 type:complete len:134 (-) Transcript_37039:109-510(-)
MQSDPISSIAKLFNESYPTQKGNIGKEELLRFLTIVTHDAIPNANLEQIVNAADKDGSGSINIEEFLSGCQRLRGESRALDLAVLRTEVLSWMGHFSNFADNVEKQLDELVNKKPIVGDRSRGRAATIAGTYS